MLPFRRATTWTISVYHRDQLNVITTRGFSMMQHAIVIPSFVLESSAIFTIPLQSRSVVVAAAMLLTIAIPILLRECAIWKISFQSSSVITMPDVIAMPCSNLSPLCHRSSCSTVLPSAQYIITAGTSPSRCLTPLLRHSSCVRVPILMIHHHPRQISVTMPFAIAKPFFIIDSAIAMIV